MMKNWNKPNKKPKIKLVQQDNNLAILRKYPL